VVWHFDSAAGLEVISVILTCSHVTEREKIGCVALLMCLACETPEKTCLELAETH